MSIKLGYKASAEQFGPRELVELTAAAERLGFDSAFASDHFQPWRHTGGHAPFALAWLAAAGERTSTIQLGTSVLTPTFRYNPAVLAQAFASLGCLFPGRVIAGFGTGEALNEIATGYRGADTAARAWPGFSERFGRLRESIRLMRALWTEDRVSFRGEYYATEGASIYDRPDVPVPVFVAAGGPVVAKYVGRETDGFICTSGKGDELYTEQLLPAVAEGLTAREHAAPGFERTIEIKLSYAPTDQAALEATRFWSPLSLTAEQKRDISDPIEMEAAAEALSLEQVAQRWIVASDPANAARAIGRYIDMGFDHLVFHYPGFDQVEFMERFAREVAPLLREWSGRPA